jgi:Rps23 Pro-64 3,4-dihydroxylase Tpa1-like proline 4-hydroxylase
MIYYLNEEFEGGQLRIYNSRNIVEKGNASFTDVDPALNTLVLFRRLFVAPVLLIGLIHCLSFFLL